MKNLHEILSIEKLNKEYIDLYHSKSSRLTRYIEILKLAGFKDSIRLIKKRSVAFLGDRKIRKNVKSIHEDFYYTIGQPIDGLKIAVYTCITSYYDVPKEPFYLGSDTSYHIFTDQNLSSDSAWIKRDIEKKEVLNVNRFYKFHPFEEFHEYDFAIYVDGNVRVVSDVSLLCSIARDSKIGIAMHTHHCRDSVYEEAKVCNYYKRGNKKKIEEQMTRYKKEGFPDRFGMCEATIIVYDLSNELAREVSEAWWDEYLFSNSLRDQLAFPYVLWKKGIEKKDVGDLGNDLWKNPKFIIHGHS